MKKLDPTSAQKVRRTPRDRAAVHRAKPHAIHPDAIWRRFEFRTLRYSLRTRTKTQMCSTSTLVATTTAAFLGFIPQKPARGMLSVAVLLFPSIEFGC